MSFSNKNIGHLKAYKITNKHKKKILTGKKDMHKMYVHC